MHVNERDDGDEGIQVNAGQGGERSTPGKGTVMHHGIKKGGNVRDGGQQHKV